MKMYLDDLSSGFVEQGREVLIVVGHGIRINLLILIFFYPNLKIVFLVDTGRAFSQVHLGAMFECHACYRVLVMHNVLERNATMHTAHRVVLFTACLTNCDANSKGCLQAVRVPRLEITR